MSTCLPENGYVQYYFNEILFLRGKYIETDITVDVVKPMLHKEIPGIMDYIRYKYGSEKPNALVSRSVAGIIDKTMIFTLPGSVKAVDEYMPEITRVLNHLIYMANDIDTH